MQSAKLFLYEKDDMPNAKNFWNLNSISHIEIPFKLQIVTLL